MIKWFEIEKVKQASLMVVKMIMNRVMIHLMQIIWILLWLQMNNRNWRRLGNVDVGPFRNRRNLGDKDHRHHHQPSWWWTCSSSTLPQLASSPSAPSWWWTWGSSTWGSSGRTIGGSSGSAGSDGSCFIMIIVMMMMMMIFMMIMNTNTMMMMICKKMLGTEKVSIYIHITWQSPTLAKKATRTNRVSCESVY